MKILVVGTGGREHAIVRKLLDSPKVQIVYCAPGNGGISCDVSCPNLSLMDTDGIIEFAHTHAIDLVFVAPENPLSAGMIDALEAAGIPAFGPSQKAAQIESSKVFSKDLMKKYSIPTADYEVFTSILDAKAYILQNETYPIVIKADGLALGKGVIIARSQTDALSALHLMMEEKSFGDSGSRVVIEEFLIGPEVSVLAFTDGKTVCPMISSKDHKRALDNDKGPNTGGMGTISPNPHYSDEMAQVCMDTIFNPTISAMQDENARFKGCLYFGLILTAAGPKVIEYNCRFGDPEAQVVLPMLETDLSDILNAVVHETLDTLQIKWKSGACACVMMASGGYPSSYPKGIEITGLNSLGQVTGATVFHSGTVLDNGVFKTNGGRVLGVTASGENIEDARMKAYQAVQKISFDGAMYRSDIGKI